MKSLLPLLIIILTSSCVTEALSPMVEKMKPVFWEESIQTLIDTNNTNQYDLAFMVDFKSVNADGIVFNLNASESFELNTKMPSEKLKSLSIIELKNENKVVIRLCGKGLWDVIWADVLVNKTNLEIENLVFDHKSETPGMGAEIRSKEFTNQFIGARLLLKGNGFSLTQNERQLVSGEQAIDGITGSTITSKGVVNMLNNIPENYEQYFLTAQMKN